MSVNIVDKSKSSKLKKIAGMLPGAFQTFNSNHFKNENNTFQLADQVTSKLVNEVNPTLAGTEVAVEGLDIGGTKYKVGGGHNMLNDPDDIEALTTDTGKYVANAYAIKQYSNTITRYTQPFTLAQGSTTTGGTYGDTTEANWYSDPLLQTASGKKVDLLFNAPETSTAQTTAFKAPARAKMRVDTTSGKACVQFAEPIAQQTQFVFEITEIRGL